MRFVLTAIGSAGDVFPFLGLALRLRQRGHDVAMIANGHFRPLLESHGIPMREFGSAEAYRQAITNPDLWHPLKGFRTVMQLIEDQRGLMQNMLEMAGREDVIIAHSLAFAARLLEESGQRKVVSIVLQPAVLRSVHEGPVMGGNHGITPLPRWMQRLCWQAVDRWWVDPLVNPILDPLRQEMHLPRQRHYFAQWLHSPRLSIGFFPEWYAPMQPDWQEGIRLMGFPLCDDVAQIPIPAALEALLESGVRPLVFTPGSAMKHAHEFFDAATKASQVRKTPAIFLTTHREQLPDQLPSGMYHFDFAPLSQILPRCCGLVHHGGIGTTAAALAAGIPQIIMPLSHDQPDNAARIVRLGLGARLWPRKFTASRLGGLLEQILHDPQITTNCRNAASRLSKVDALEQTCQLIEQTMA